MRSPLNAAQLLLADHDDRRLALVCGSDSVTRGGLPLSQTSATRTSGAPT